MLCCDVCGPCWQVEFCPTKMQLATMIGSIAGHLTESLANIQRLPDLLTRTKSNKEVTFNISLFTSIDVSITTCMKVGGRYKCLRHPSFNILCIVNLYTQVITGFYYKCLCIFGRKGAIQIHYYYYY